MILPVVGALLHAFRCTRLPSGVYTLDKDPSVQCWQGWHAAFAAAAFVALLMYVWLCTRLIRVGTQLSDIEVHGLRDMLPWTGWRKDVFHPLRRSPMSFAQTAHMQVLNVVKLLLLTLSVSRARCLRVSAAVARQLCPQHVHAGQPSEARAVRIGDERPLITAAA